MHKRHWLPLVKQGLAEDLGRNRDITTNSIIPAFARSVFTLIAKDEGILSGAEVFDTVFRQLDRSARIDWYFCDGNSLKKGDIVARVRGRTRAILVAERTAVNLISHLSGIATKTATFVRASKGAVRILDTRKTIPGLRMLQKYAVVTGGGENHRMGLHDMVMIKDNHIDAAGGITLAVTAVRKRHKNRFKIEVEARTLDEVGEAIQSGADRIMLDNMSNELMTEAVTLIAGRAETEASGNITIERLATMTEIGLDFVSIGELTHSVQIFDFSLKQES